MAPIITLQNVSKKFSRRADQHLSYGLTDLFAEIFGRGRSTRFRTDEFLAVDGISLSIQPGETLAVIGRNGSGKTTLLKMLAGLLKPDGGRIEIDGTIQALIALGTGFNPRLSGRDNIYNQAALMNYSRRQADAIVDTIIDFAELEDFIDSPVETYSSGMKARLGFSVSVHLKPDIFLIDEILAVGDMAFQNKCFIKMQQLKASGLTMILVTHNVTSVIQMCDRALWLHQGRAMGLGDAKEVCGAYVEFLQEIEGDRAAEANALRRKLATDMAEDDKRRAERAAEEEKVKDRKQGQTARESIYHGLYPDRDRVDDIEVSFRVNGRQTDILRTHDELVIDYSFRLVAPVEELNVSLVFYHQEGTQLAAISTLNGDLLAGVRSGTVHATVRIPDFNLSPGRYVLVMPIHAGKSYLYRDIVKEFAVKAGTRMAWALMDFTYEYTVHPQQRNAQVG